LKEIRVGDYVFLCANELEAWRAKTLFKKEKGTVKWLLAEAGPKDVFYDVGANIGLYTVVAAKQGARVVAFEPHVGNASSLLRNLEANGIVDRVVVVTAALHCEEAVIPFNYVGIQSGSSGHQLGHNVGENGKAFAPAAVELKVATTIDALRARGVIAPATLVKIDVDGNEKLILRGMAGLLASRPPRNVQVEIHPSTRDGIVAFMVEHGYPANVRHDTLHGKVMMQDGMPSDGIAYNAIFKRSA
jgi:FkbM family methyltransferase